MEAHWKSDKCYNEYGVDGSSCSIRVYLSEVETWCPLLPGRSPATLNSTKAHQTKDKNAELNFDMEDLMSKLQDPGQRHNYAWIRMRIGRMWKNWVDAMKSLAEQQDLSGRRQKKVRLKCNDFCRVLYRFAPLSQKVCWSASPNEV